MKALDRRSFLKAGVGGLAALALGRGLSGAEQSPQEFINAPCNFTSGYTFRVPICEKGKVGKKASLVETWNQGDMSSKDHIICSGNYVEEKDAKGNDIIVEIGMYEEGTIGLSYHFFIQDRDGKKTYLSENPGLTRILYFLPPGSAAERELHAVSRYSLKGEAEDLHGVPSKDPLAKALTNVNIGIETGASVSDEDKQLVEEMTKKRGASQIKLETVAAAKKRGLSIPFSNYDGHRLYQAEICPPTGESKESFHIGRKIGLLFSYSPEAKNSPIGVWIPQLTFSGNDSEVRLENLLFNIEPLNEASKAIRKSRADYLESRTPEAQRKRIEERRKKRAEQNN